ncbi:MAG: hypothetical protein DMG67_08400 [Acidobacteria bacterium]|nr:MAG: hypothetical protein DMG67_08400 [Acidobacteriota bacterium]
MTTCAGSHPGIYRRCLRCVDVVAFLFLLFFIGCAHRSDPGTLVMIIESRPTNLDPRVGIDGQSERIGMLLYDAVFRRDEHFNLQPMLAERWEIPDPATYVFHLRSGVRFHDGRPLTSRDVKYTIDSMLKGVLRSPKTATSELCPRAAAQTSTTTPSAAAHFALCARSRIKKLSLSVTPITRIQLCVPT